MSTLENLKAQLAALPPDGTRVPGERPDFVAKQRKALKELIVAALKSK
jgi:hypothetical protein